jgi:hypothetical protein
MAILYADHAAQKLAINKNGNKGLMDSLHSFVLAVNSASLQEVFCKLIRNLHHQIPHVTWHSQLEV